MSSRLRARWYPGTTGSALGREGIRVGCSAGMVTAEAAVVLPLLALVALALVWLVSIGIAQVRVVDAARDAARAVARGDDSDAAVRAARRTAGRDSVVRITTSGGLVSVDVSERVAAPGWLLAPLPPVTVRSTSRIGAEGEPEAR